MKRKMDGEVEIAEAAVACERHRGFCLTLKCLTQRFRAIAKSDPELEG